MALLTTGAPHLIRTAIVALAEELTIRRNGGDVGGGGPKLPR